MTEQMTPLRHLFDDEFDGYGDTTEYGDFQGIVNSNIHLGHLQPAADLNDEFEEGLRRIRDPNQCDSNTPASPTKKRAGTADDSSNISNEHVSKRQKTNEEEQVGKSSSVLFGVGDPIFCNFNDIRFNGLYRVKTIEFAEGDVVLRKTWPSEGAGRIQKVTVTSAEAKLEKKIWINAKDHTVMPLEH